MTLREKTQELAEAHKDEILKAPTLKARLAIVHKAVQEHLEAHPEDDQAWFEQYA